MLSGHLTSLRLISVLFFLWYVSFFELTALHLDVFLLFPSIEEKHASCWLVESSEYGQIKDSLQVLVSIAGISQTYSFYLYCFCILIFCFLKCLACSYVHAFVNQSLVQLLNTNIHTCWEGNKVENTQLFSLFFLMSFSPTDTYFFYSLILSEADLILIW